MTNLEREQVAAPHLELFDPRFAPTVVGWVRTSEELRRLAPSTSWPLTAEKMLAWKKPSNEAVMLIRTGDPLPIAYGELNPMRRDPEHCWLGHIIVDPKRRGCGMGKAFVRAMVNRAFAEHLANRISLIVFPENLAAIQCYCSSGFTIIGDEYHKFGDTGPKCRFLRLEITALAQR